MNTKKTLAAAAVDAVDAYFSEVLCTGTDEEIQLATKLHHMVEALKTTATPRCHCGGPGDLVTDVGTMNHYVCRVCGRAFKLPKNGGLRMPPSEKPWVDDQKWRAALKRDDDDEGA